MKTRKKPLFDRSVLLTFILAALTGLLVSGYKLLTYQDCTQADFAADAGRMVAGKLIRFQDLTPGARSWKWDFGDSTSSVTDRKTMHTFDFPGTYWVSLEVNGKCLVQKKVVIEPDIPVVDSGNYPRFDAPLTARVGEAVRFSDQTPGAVSWQWSFGESKQVDDTTRAPEYVYTAPGTKTITLVVNGGKTVRKRITVFSRPVRRPRKDLSLPAGPRIEVPAGEEDPVPVSKVPLPPPVRPVEEKPASPQISRVQFEEWLLQIAEEKREAQTLAPYCCAGLDTEIRMQGKASTLKELCGKIKGKKIDVRTLELIRSADTGCIHFIRIDYKRKGVLGIF